MNSILLQISLPILRLLLIASSIIALLRGHNYPGGGFIGGLLAALATVYSILAYSYNHYKLHRKVKAEWLIGFGLSCAIASLLPSITTHAALMKGVWSSINIGTLSIKLGTPFLFDIGVYFTVIGVTILFFTTLIEVRSWKHY